jgi:hypothetical protein
MGALQLIFQKLRIHRYIFENKDAKSIFRHGPIRVGS